MDYMDYIDYMECMEHMLHYQRYWTRTEQERKGRDDGIHPQ